MLFEHIVLDRLYILIGKYEMRLKINHFCGNIYNFQEKLQENVKMQSTEIPIKIFIIILKLVIRILLRTKGGYKSVFYFFLFLSHLCIFFTAFIYLNGS